MKRDTVQQKMDDGCLGRLMPVREKTDAGDWKMLMPALGEGNGGGRPGYIQSNERNVKIRGISQIQAYLPDHAG